MSHQKLLAAKQEEERKKFYNQPDANADFDYYCKCPYWTLDEAIALSLGKDPVKVNWNTVCSLRNSTSRCRICQTARSRP